MTHAERDRKLTESERELALHMLEHGIAEARDFILQLDFAEVTPWRCACGCASIEFQLPGEDPAPQGVHVLGDYLFGGDFESELSGAFIYSSGGVLKGLEVYALGGDPPATLPHPASLRPVE